MLSARLDLELDPLESRGVRFVEFKSYKLTSIEKYLSVKQLKAYFESSSSIGEMKYVFNKLETPNVAAVKAEFQKIFEKDPKEFFDSLNEGIKTQLDLDSSPIGLAKFKEMIKNPNSELYEFIGVE